MKILVTGGAGYIGSRLSESLADLGHKIVVVDTFWFGNSLSSRGDIEFIQGDIREFDREWLDGVETVIHLAAVANDPSADLDPQLSWEIGALGTRNIFEAMLGSSAKRIIIASSGSVYGVKSESKVTEDLSLLPISVYNKVKMIKERVALSYADKISVVILRPATVCGLSKRLRLDLAVNAITFDALSSRQVNVDGGDQMRPHLHIEDMVSTYIHFVDNPELIGIYNVGFENMTIKDLALLVSEKTGAEVHFNNSSDPRSYKLDSSKLLNTGFQPKKNIENAISDLTQEYSESGITASSLNYNVKWMKSSNERN
jgi:nucleoside-diphosphate-sugar epimerase